MRTVSLLRRQIVWEQKMFWRNPAAAVFTFVFPLIFLVIFSTINSGDTVDVAGEPVDFTQYYVPSIVVFGVISACYTALAFTLSLRRLQGILKRKRGTPLTAAVYMGGMIGSALIVAAILTAVTIAAGVAFYDFTFPEVGARLPRFVLVLAVAAFCFSALGVLVSTVVPNEDSAPAIINVVLFPLIFISGTFGPISEGSVLTKIAQNFPVWHAIHAVTSLLQPSADGSIDWDSLALIAAWGAGATILAVRRFRWDPDVAMRSERARARRAN